MTERQLYAFNHIGHMWLLHPGLKDKNIEILRRYNINLSECKTGPGFDELGKLNLDEDLKNVQEMGLMDEMLSNPKESLEVCRAASMKLNYTSSKEITHIKGVA